MTPKEKAEELFINYIHKGMNQIQPVINRVIRKEMAKQCSLIAVDEIIKENYPQDVKRCEYWLEVIKEIQKL